MKKLRCYAECPQCGTEAPAEEDGLALGFIIGNCSKCQVRFHTTDNWWRME